MTLQKLLPISLILISLGSELDQLLVTHGGHLLMFPIANKRQAAAARHGSRVVRRVVCSVIYIKLCVCCIFRASLVY